MQLETRQGGLFREALRLVTSPTQSVLPSIDELIRRNRDSIMTALWQYWVAAPKFVYQWVPPQSWPDEVRNSTQAPQGTKKNAPPKSLALSQFSNRGVYVWSPKLAILASLGVIKTNDAKEAAKASYSRPRQLVRLGDDLIALQALVSAPRVFDALRATFGASIVDPLVTGGTLPFEPQTIGDVIDRARPFLVAPRVRAPAELTVRGSQGRPDFTLHVEVARQARQVLGDDLPFAERDGTLPPDVTKWLANIDAIETQLQWALSSSGLINNVQYAPWLPWGLALTAVLRAYATEAFALAALVSLPIGTLYFTPTDGAFAANARTPLIGDRRWVKYSYNAYTAVGLWEAWTGRPVPHADPADVQTYYGGPNYLWRAGDRPTEPLESVAARNIDAFTRFWQDGTGPSFHAPLAGRIQTWSLEQSGVPRLPSDRHAAPGATKKPAGKKGTKNSDNIPISAVGSIESGTEWAIIPALRFPGHDPQGGDHREILANLWHRCAHLHVHVGLYAAEQIYDKLGQLSGLPPPGGKKSTEKPAIRRALTIHDGSPRWGGNHAPHFEHRDGLTFDIFTPFHYAQWLRASKAYDRQEKTPVNFAIFGVCLTQAQHDQKPKPRPTRRHLVSDFAEAINGQLPFFLAKLANSPASQAEVDQFLKDAKLGGTPVHGGDRPNDDALQTNLLGHVALALGGIRKLIYAGVIQHVYALTLAAQALHDDEYARPVIAKMVKPGFAEFVLAPEDHHDHWHVVFPGRANWLEGSPSDLIRYLQFWQRLGIDFSPLVLALKERTIADVATVLRDRQLIVQLLEANGKKRPETDPTLLQHLAEAIVARRYPSGDVLESGVKDVKERYQIDDWDDTPSDTVETN